LDGKTESVDREHVVLGMAAGLGAFFMFSIMVVFARLLSANHSVIEIAFYRNLIGCMPFLFVVFVLGRRHILELNTKPYLVGIRAVLGSVSLVTTFFAYSLMPLADTTALLFTSSLLIPVLAVVILKETVGPYRWFAVAVGFALAVTYPSAGNIGGGGFMVIHLADGNNITIDFREKAPLSAHRDMYLNEAGEFVPELSQEGTTSAGVPGSVAGLIFALEKDVKSGRDMQFKLSTSSGAVFVGTLNSGQQSG